jgi:hypothetical protein
MSEGAPERGGGDRGEEEARGCFTARKSARIGCCPAELRREILPAWRRFQRELERAKVEEVQGLL